MDESDPIMLQKKWKMIDTTPLAEGSYWVTGLEMLDLTQLAGADAHDAGISFQQTESRNRIKLKNSDVYFEILKLINENLEIGLCIPNPETKEENKVALLSYQAFDE